MLLGGENCAEYGCACEFVPKLQCIRPQFRKTRYLPARLAEHRRIEITGKKYEPEMAQSDLIGFEEPIEN